MNWLGPELDRDQRDMAAVLEALALDRALTLTDDAEVVARLVCELADLGIWTLGVAQDARGGGADQATTCVALHQLGRYWPALGWASAQAHAAADVLGSDSRYEELVSDLHAGKAAVAVIDAESPRVRLAGSDNGLTGVVHRVDVASLTPHLLLLAADTATLVRAEAITSLPVRRTGLDGALTRALEIDTGARGPEVEEIQRNDISGVRIRLWLGAAAVATGIAAAAHDAALQYTAQRHQFGGPLTALPTIRQALLAQAARTATALTSTVAGAGRPETALAALEAACEAAVDVAASAVQCHGGYGYLAEYPAERHLRDAVSLRAAVDVTTTAVQASRALVGMAWHNTLTKEAS